MGNVLSLLLKVVSFFRWAAVMLALYAWIWLPNFQRGAVGGPYWLLPLYDRAIPLMLGTGVVGFAIVWFYRLLAGMFMGGKPAAISNAFHSGLIWLVGLSLFAGVPSFLAQYNYLQAVAFNNDNYHLLQRANGSVANYMVFECADPIGFWCHQVLISPDVAPPPATPTPLPEVTAVVNNEIVVITPFPVPTITPPAQLITDTLGVELSLQIGNARAVVTNTMTADDLAEFGLPTPVPTATVTP